MNSAHQPARCRLCQHETGGHRLPVREMMFGSRQTFDYRRCDHCGGLQLDEIPANLAEFYPANYYSFHETGRAAAPVWTRFKRRWLHPAMTRHITQQDSFAGHLLCHLFKHPLVPEWLRFLARPVRFADAVLDVGSGSGGNLMMLQDSGFTNLRGVDPFIAESVALDGGVRVEKCELSAVAGKFQLIMFHHVFEHLATPLAALQLARERLAEGGQILIRVPLADSVAAEKYGVHWVQLDAPRHLVVPTRRGLAEAARLAGLKIVRVAYDSSEFQFWGSEQYVRDIPLWDRQSNRLAPAPGLFASQEMESFRNQAAELNRQEKGDQAAFVLQAA